MAQNQKETAEGRLAAGGDAINPAHYKGVVIRRVDGAQLQVEVEDIVAALNLDPWLFTAMIYVARAGKKPTSSYTEDVAKAIWWLKRGLIRHGGHPEV